MDVVNYDLIAGRKDPDGRVQIHFNVAPKLKERLLAAAERAGFPYRNLLVSALLQYLDKVEAEAAVPTKGRRP